MNETAAELTIHSDLMGRLRRATAVIPLPLPSGAAFVTNVSVAAGRGDIFVWGKHNVRIKS